MIKQRQIKTELTSMLSGTYCRLEEVQSALPRRTRGTSLSPFMYYGEVSEVDYILNDLSVLY